MGKFFGLVYTEKHSSSRDAFQLFWYVIDKDNVMNAVELAQKSSSLFTLPDVYMRLGQLIRKPETRIDDIAE